jgi:hypothetical protein
MIQFSVDATDKGAPFPHYWEQCVGSCNAIMGVRSDWRDTLSHRLNNNSPNGELFVEPPIGFEPMTCRLRIGCTANCATVAFFVVMTLVIYVS